MPQTADDNPAQRRSQLLAQFYWPPLFLLALAVGFVLAFPAAIALWFLYHRVVPAYSASTHISEIQTTVTLRFYYTDTDQGRYLYVKSPNGGIRIAMTAFDWAHDGRTSIYLTPQHKVGVAGPAGDDYLVSLDPPIVENARGYSDDWAYLGAFDFGVGIGTKRLLRFVSAAEEAECIPMRGAAIENFQVRKNARQKYCRR
jgi:hypothetical protein